jgi:hypothetical protein
MTRLAIVAVLAAAMPARADVLGTQLQRFDDHAHHRRRIVAVITASVGAASVAVGAAHGIGAFVDWHHLTQSNRCDAFHVCNADGARLTDRAASLARAADIFLGSGLVVVAIAAGIWISARDVQIAPVYVPDGAGVVARTQF